MSWGGDTKESHVNRKANGTYVLVLHVQRALEIEVRALGVCEFKAGWYLYVGSALSGLRFRIGRHLNKRKLSHWHIDYLTNVAHIGGAAILESKERLECRIADKLKTGLGLTPGFGCNDCRCRSHLFFSESEAEAWGKVEMAIAGFDVDCRLMDPNELRVFLKQS